MRASSNATRLVCRNACISDNEEGGAEDDDDAADADAVTDTAADDAAPDNDSYVTMPPKLKAPPRKPPAPRRLRGTAPLPLQRLLPPPPSRLRTSPSTQRTRSLWHTTPRASMTSLT